jgi:hypothetical protein
MMVGCELESIFGEINRSRLSCIVAIMTESSLVLRDSEGLIASASGEMAECTSSVGWVNESSSERMVTF